MKLVISSGHGKYIRGASGYLDEVDEARKVVENVATKLRSSGVQVQTFHDDISDDQSENLNRIVNYHNAQSRDFDISVHFNAYNTTSNPMGTEVLYVTQSSKASGLSSSIATAGTFPNRGGKKRTDLFFLNNTEKPALLIETCFVDSKADADDYHRLFDEICAAISKFISGEEPPTEQPPVEQPPEPEIEESRVVIDSKHYGNVIITFNGQKLLVGGDRDTQNYVRITLDSNIPVTVNGQDYHNIQERPPEPEAPPESEDEMPRPTIGKGDYGFNVREVQFALEVSDVDGDYGDATVDAVEKYQVDKGLSVDGMVGPGTWAQLDEDFVLSSYPPPLPALFSDSQVSHISNIAASHPIANYSWRDRGQAPDGYVKGMAVAYAQACRRFKSNDPIAKEMSKANTGNDDIDALSYYNSNFVSLGMRNDEAGIDTLRHLYVLLMGLGMRESSGQYCCGRDQSASNTDSNTCEAGLFQTSWNASNCCTDFVNLFDQYDVSSPQGYQSIFSEDVSCSSSNWKSYGSGDGYDFQEICKWSPTFAVETCAIGLRCLRQHWGPINRKEVELRQDADNMFKQVQDYIDTLG
jgi:hypothetical protein